MIYIWKHFLPDSSWQRLLFLGCKIILCFVASLHRWIQQGLSLNPSQKYFSMTEDMKLIEIYYLKQRGLFNTLKKQRIWNSPRIFDLKNCSITTVQRREVVRKILNLDLIDIMLLILLLSWGTRFIFTISNSCRGCKCNCRFSMALLTLFMPNDKT